MRSSLDEGNTFTKFLFRFYKRLPRAGHLHFKAMSKKKTTTSSKKAETKPKENNSASEAKGSKPASESTAASSASSSASSSSGGIQNGKGSAPRNISPQFRSNYDGISWESNKKKAKKPAGEKFVKVY